MNGTRLPNASECMTTRTYGWRPAARLSAKRASKAARAVARFSSSAAFMLMNSASLPAATIAALTSSTCCEGGPEVEVDAAGSCSRPRRAPGTSPRPCPRRRPGSAPSARGRRSSSGAPSWVGRRLGRRRHRGRPAESTARGRAQAADACGSAWASVCGPAGIEPRSVRARRRRDTPPGDARRGIAIAARRIRACDLRGSSPIRCPGGHHGILGRGSVLPEQASVTASATPP